MLLAKHCSLILIAALGAATAVADDSRPFTTAGSTGTVDESDLGIVTLSGPYVAVSAAAPAGSTADVRYNVIDLQGLHGYDRYIMRVRFLDNGASAHVIVRLKEYNIATGATITRMTLDSNAFAPGAAYQTQSVDSGCWPGWSFNFDLNVYFIEVELQKTGAGGTPSLAAIQIGGSLC
ncbi:MAG: hypothetical protein U1E76_26140 [Planctomycetota bacterium]